MAADGTKQSWYEFPRLMPAAALVRRELLTTLRGGRAFGFLALMTASMAAVLSLYLLDAGSIDVTNVRAMDNLTQLMFHTFCYGLYIAGLLLAPPVAAAAICTEKQLEQLDLVRMTYVTPYNLLLGKFINILGVYAFVILAALPFAGVMLFFTGVDAGQYLQAIYLIGLTVGSGTMIGLYFSARFFRTIPSMLVTYVVVLLTQFGLAIPVWLAFPLLLRGVPIMSDTDFAEVLFATVFPGFGILVISEATLHPSFYVAVLLFHGGIMALAAWRARRILDRPLPTMNVDTRKIIDDPAELEQRRKAFPYYLLDPQRRRAHIGDQQNPMLVKERYTGLANRGTTAIRILYSTAIIAVVVGAFMAVRIDYTRDGLTGAWQFIFVETLLLIVVAPAFVATSISKEREWGNWDMLRTTLLTPGQVVLGKLFAAVRSFGLPVAALLAGGLPFLAMSGSYPDTLDGLAFGVIMMAVTALYILAISLVAGMGHSQSSRALLSAYGTCLLLLVVIPLIAIVFVAFSSPYRFTTDALRYAAWFSPIFMQFVTIDELPYERDSLIIHPYVLSHVAVFLLLSLNLVCVAYLRCRRTWTGAHESQIAVARAHARREALS